MKIVLAALVAATSAMAENPAAREVVNAKVRIDELFSGPFDRALVQAEKERLSVLVRSTAGLDGRPSDASISHCWLAVRLLNGDLDRALDLRAYPSTHAAATAIEECSREGRLN